MKYFKWVHEEVYLSLVEGKFEITPYIANNDSFIYNFQIEIWNINYLSWMRQYGVPITEPVL